jgi:hypothetical protein
LQKEGNKIISSAKIEIETPTLHLLISDRLVDRDDFFLLWGRLGLDQRPVDLKNIHHQAA